MQGGRPKSASAARQARARGNARPPAGENSASRPQASTAKAAVQITLSIRPSCPSSCQLSASLVDEEVIGRAVEASCASGSRPRRRPAREPQARRIGDDQERHCRSPERTLVRTAQRGLAKQRRPDRVQHEPRRERGPAPDCSTKKKPGDAGGRERAGEAGLGLRLRRERRRDQQSAGSELAGERRGGVARTRDIGTLVDDGDGRRRHRDEQGHGNEATHRRRDAQRGDDPAGAATVMAPHPRSAAPPPAACRYPRGCPRAVCCRAPRPGRPARATPSRAPGRRPLRRRRPRAPQARTGSLAPRCRRSRPPRTWRRSRGPPEQRKNAAASCAGGKRPAGTSRLTGTAACATSSSRALRRPSFGERARVNTAREPSSQPARRRGRPKLAQRLSRPPRHALRRAGTCGRVHRRAAARHPRAICQRSAGSTVTRLDLRRREAATSPMRAAISA